ncbi:metallophosphoesterase family protein [Desulfovirgula thermocuniculi]|uniref:metallophosphoesterase family protein n=1 Tax=Desulfovirgula thermocuniculi TaxID=348842 RepID=UPI00041B1CEB|nr:YfcE family phosphodiesterase [Desulfovirgula thermocuniculi]
MRLGLVSDTHGELENLRLAIKKMLEDWRVEVLAHLGDECEDVEAVRELWKGELIQVPGVYCEHYRDPGIQNRLVRELGGYRVLFTHSREPHANDLPGDLNPLEVAARGEVEVVAYGHTHVPAVSWENGVLWVNPGHLKAHDKKGHGPSFAVLALEEKGVTAYLVDLHAGVSFAEHFAPRGGFARFSF